MIESNGGYEVVEASGDLEAITLVRQVRPHIIILDLVVQDDGVDFLEAVKADESTRSIPIIAVTTGDLPQEERNKLNRRVEALLQKGLFEKQELLADVTAALERIKGG
jgi:CheY-like chemotaxis protein